MHKGEPVYRHIPELPSSHPWLSVTIPVPARRRESRVTFQVALCIFAPRSASPTNPSLLLGFSPWGTILVPGSGSGTWLGALGGQGRCLPCSHCS